MSSPHTSPTTCKGRIALALLIALAASTCRAQQKAGEARPANVYILAGQSNMEGVGRVAQLATGATAASSAYMFHSRSVGKRGQHNQWRALGPAGWQGLPDGGFGIELALGPDLVARSGQPAYLVKHAVGGTSLAHDWDPLDGREYRALDQLVQSALAQLRDQGLRPVVRGVFWQQGEADAKNAERGHAYAHRLQNFVVRLRARLAELDACAAASDVRFVLGQVIPSAPPGSKAHTSYPFRDAVRSAQLALPDVVRNAACVATDPSFQTHADDGDGFRDQDNAHFNEAGLDKLGHSMAAAYAQPDRGATIEAGTGAQPATGANTLRVISYNTYYIFAKGKQVDAASRWLARQAPDVVALQELTNTTEDRLRSMAKGWQHPHAALLKERGFSVGLTSRQPIEVLARLTDGLHHGCLHVRTAGVHAFLVHLSPFAWRKRTEEARTILNHALPLLQQGEPVLVLGDFNAHSRADQQLLRQQPQTLASLRKGDASHSHVENLRDGQYDFSVMAQFFANGLLDVSLPYLQQARSRRWTFPTGILSQPQGAAPSHGQRIDYVLASAQLAAATMHASVQRAGLVNQLSDHYPVLVEFRQRR